MPAGARIADLDVEINLTHSNMIDLDAVLQAPGGNQVGLFTDVGSNFIPELDLRFDDEASLPTGNQLISETMKGSLSGSTPFF